MDVMTKRRLFYVVSILLVLGVVSSHRLIELHNHWTTPADMDMGYLLLIVFAYFYHRALKENLAHKLSPLYLVPLSFVSVAIYLAELLNLKSVFFLQFPLLGMSLTGLFFGTKTLLKSLSAIGIVSMALPFWYAAISPLQSMTVWASSKAIELTQLTALVEGTYITLPSGTVHIAGGCSGLKYLLSAITLSLVSSALNRSKLSITILLILCAAALAILANWVRVISLVGIGYTEGVSHPLMADHDFFGWVIFGVFIAIYFLIDQRVSVTNPINYPAGTTKQKKITSHEVVIFAAAMLLLSSPLMYSKSLKQQTGEQGTNTRLAINIPSSAQHKNFARTWYPDFPINEQAKHFSIIKNTTHYDVSVLRYFNWGEKELAKTTNSVFPNDSWRIIRDEPWSLDSLRMRIAVAKNNQTYRVVFYWYDHEGTQLNGILQSKIQLLRDSLRGTNFASLVAISHPCSFDCANVNEPPTWLIENIRNTSNL